MKLKIIQVIVVEDDSMSVPMPTPKADKYHLFLMTGKELCKISDKVGLASGLDVIMAK